MITKHSIFISYRRRETAFAVDHLDRALNEAFGDHAAFRDVRSIRKGHSFPEDIRAALAESRVGLVVIGPWWLTVGEDQTEPEKKGRLHDPEDWVRMEVEALLQRRTAAGEPIPVIPLYTGGAEPPKVDDLPECLKALATRDGLKLDSFPNDAHSIQLIVKHVGGLLGVTPRAAAPVREVESKAVRVSAGRLTVTGKKFVGRERELYLLDEAWGRSAQDKINTVSFIGQGGEGKTALVAEWCARRAHHGWTGARRVFDWSFYSQGTSDQSSASSEAFFEQALRWFGHEGEIPKDARAKGLRLAELVAAEKTLLVLDGLEPLQQPPGGYAGEFKEPAMKALLRGLALNNPGLCVLTSRVEIADLANYEHEEGTCIRHRLEALDMGTARELLRELGVAGPGKELDEAIRWFHGHAYDLNLLGNFLAKCTKDHDIRGWRERFPLLKEDEKIHPKADANGKRAGHGRRMLRAYERWLGGESAAMNVLRLLGLFDRPVRSDLLDELRAAPAIPGLTKALVELGEGEWLETINALQDLGLIRRETVSVPDKKTEPEQSDAPEVPDALVEMVLQRPDLPPEMKGLSKAELKRLLAQFMGGGKPQAAKAQRPRRPVSYAVDAHPLLREHFAAELREGSLEAWMAGHRRLYEYLCASTPDKAAPTLEDLQPLYQAVAHGCQAGLQREAVVKVYRSRILRGTGSVGHYSTRMLGAFDSDLGAVASFFEQPWSRVSAALTEADQAWLLSEAAYRLRALGRLKEALQPVRAALDMRIRQNVWVSAAITAGNLSDLEMTLGMIEKGVEHAGALADAEMAVVYADRSKDGFQKITKRSTHGYILHQVGRFAGAAGRFREAEGMQAKRQPEFPLLYSAQGFWYCNLLLRDVERGAWQRALGSRGAPSESLAGGGRGLPCSKALSAVGERAARILKWEEGMRGAPVFDIALHHLTLGRVGLYGAVLQDDEMTGEGSPAWNWQRKLGDSPDIERTRLELDAAVEGLRRAGKTDGLPEGLLTRAWGRAVWAARVGGQSAVSDLNEAWEIAERGPMPLFMAEIHLYRARLFFREKEYPWSTFPAGHPRAGEERGPADDLAEARQLIEKHGYGRRLGELEDAEKAILGGVQASGKPKN